MCTTILQMHTCLSSYVDIVKQNLSMLDIFAQLSVLVPYVCISALKLGQERHQNSSDHEVLTALPEPAVLHYWWRFWIALYAIL